MNDLDMQIYITITLDTYFTYVNLSIPYIFISHILSYTIYHDVIRANTETCTVALN